MSIGSPGKRSVNPSPGGARLAPAARGAVILLGVFGALFTASRASAACQFELSGPGAAFTPDGGKGSVTVLGPSTCAWTVEPGPGTWIQGMTPRSGTGRKTITFSVARNAGPSSRTSSWRIAGQTFVIGQGASFLDVLPTHAFFSEISEVSAWGIDVGCGGGAFCPDEAITREQLAILIARALGADSPEAPGSQRFSDVEPGRSGYASINELAGRGIALPCGPDRFCPDARATREDVAVFVERAIGVFTPAPPASPRFLDVPPSRPGYAFVEDAVRRGILSGCGTTSFCPDDLLTRARAADTISRAFQLATPPVREATADVVRYLEQATFGPTEELVSGVTETGIAAHIEEQFAEPASGYPSLAPWPFQPPEDCTGTCLRDNYTQFPLQVQFFKNALTGPDQLRQRVAFALAQIFVVSGTEIRQPSSLAPFLRILTNGAFGNFRQLLHDVTLNPAMGRYLDMANNDRPDPRRGLEPNENYARELLQLFSLGLYELNPDGTRKTDAQGQPVPAYDQDVIEGFAHVFTGWTYATQEGQPKRRHNPDYYLLPMELYPGNHDTGPKKLLSGETLPGSQDGHAELNAALDNIFNHPNVGPFIGRQLIQHLVTSNPSPAYVARVSAAFTDNGSGIRGDMKAVVRAILLDPEARGDIKTAPEYGHLREPVLFVTGLCRAFGAASDGVLNSVTSNLGQNLFYPPSVFNYYPPDYVVPGTTVQGPEFAITSSSAAIGRVNLVNQLAFSKIQPAAPATGTSIDFTALAELSAFPEALVNSLNRFLLHGTMSVAMKNAVVAAVNSVPASDPLRRARTAFYLVASSPQYQVKR